MMGYMKFGIVLAAGVTNYKGAPSEKATLDS